MWIIYNDYKLTTKENQHRVLAEMAGWLLFIQKYNFQRLLNIAISGNITIHCTIAECLDCLFFTIMYDAEINIFMNIDINNFVKK